MKIEVLGDGCAKCRVLVKNVREAVVEAAPDAEVVSVSDPERIAHYGL